jgi:curved DNA-binding protein CbpA
MSSLKPDYYAVLGVQPSSTPEEIKAAFRKLAMLHHPDRKGDPLKFKEVNEAAEVIADEERRKEYDKERSNALVQDVTESARGVVEDYFRQFQQR